MCIMIEIRKFCSLRKNSSKTCKFHWSGTWINLHSVSSQLLRNIVAFVFIVSFCDSDLNRWSKINQDFEFSVLDTESVSNFSEEINARYSGLLLKSPGLDSKSALNNAIILSRNNPSFNKHVPRRHKRDIENFVLRRPPRQIVPLAKTTMKPTATTEISRTSPEIERTAKLYRDFLVDYAIYKEWTSAQLIIPHDAYNLCYYFTVEMILSKSLLTLNCSEELQHTSNRKGGHRGPIIIADFLDMKRNANSSPIDHQLLINPTPYNPVVLLANNDSVSQLLEQIQPEVQINYKWTLVKRLDDDVMKRVTLEISDIYGLSTTLTPLAQRIGTWDEADGLVVFSPNITRLANFQQQKLRITTVGGPPFVNLFPTPDALIATGYLPDILESISVFLNFKFVLLTPADGKFGDQDHHGNWSGMVGMLQRNEADIALMSFSFTKSRVTAMDFSPPVEYSATRLLIRRDVQVSELKWDAFFKPFEWKVWATIPLLIALGAITLAIFAIFGLIQTTPGENVWLLSTCFLLQGQSEHSTIRVTPFRIASGTFWLLAVFIFACYTARLTSFLAADTEKLPLRDLQEAVRSYSWKVGLVKGSSFLERVKESGAEEMRLLWQRLQGDSSVLVSGYQDGINKVYKEKFIFFTGESIPTFLLKGNCSYMWLPGNYFPGFGYMGYQQGLPYSSAVTHTVAKLRENGEMRRLFKKWWGAESKCSARSRSDAFTAISLHETGSAFIILVIGASLSVSFMLLELIATVKRNNWQTNTFGPKFSSNEFAAPIVHGTVSSFLPLLSQTSDRPFVWNVEYKPMEYGVIHSESSSVTGSTHRRA